MEKINSLVSIVVPLHNCEQFIKETIQSILDQTYSNFEILIVDDCSTDKSLEIINDFNNQRIRVIHNETQKGAAYSRNIAIKEAKGDYIAFLDSDDLWDCNKLEKQLAFMVNNDFKFSATQYEFISSDGTPLNRYLHCPKKITHRGFKRTNYIGCLTVMYKKDVYPNLAIPDNILKRNDYALWLLLSEKATCYVMEDILAKYRKHSTSNSISSGSKLKLFKSEMEMLIKLYKYNKVHAFFAACKISFFYILKKVFFLRKLKKR